MTTTPKSRPRTSLALVAAGFVLLGPGPAARAGDGPATEPSPSAAPVRVLEPLRHTLAESARVRVAAPLSLRLRQPEAAAGDDPLPEAMVVELIRLTQDWAEAWSRGRVDDYLSFYSPDFAPPEGLDRERWEEQRRVRLESPAFIEVTVSAIGVRPLEPGRASVRFVQRYRSDLYADTVRKHLDLGWENSTWKILREEVEAPARRTPPEPETDVVARLTFEDRG